MIVRKAMTVTNNRYAASVGVEFSSLEMQYAKAYGEPIIELNGVINYVPSTDVPPADQIPLDLNAEIGTSDGSSAVNAAVSGLTVKGSGLWDDSPISANGFFHYAEDVVGDFQFTADLLSIAGAVSDTTDGGYRIGLAAFRVNDPLAPAVILGVGSNDAGAFSVAALVSDTQGAGLTIENPTTLTQPITGIKLRITRTSNDVLFEFSVDGGATFEEVAELEISGAAWNVGLFVSSGHAVNQATAVFNKISLTHAEQGSASQFTIGGEKRVMMRSQAPHQFSLDKNLDSEAQTKVLGWANTIETRLQAAISSLLANQNPNVADNDTVTQH